MKRFPLVCLIVSLTAAAWALAPAGRAAKQSPAQTERAVESAHQKKDGGRFVERAAQPDEGEFVPGEVLVMFRDGADADEAVSKGRPHAGHVAMSRSQGLTKIFERFGVRRAGRLFAGAKSAKLARVVKLKAESNAGDEETLSLVAELRRLPEVEFAEPNMIMKIQAAPNDPYYATAGAWGQGFGDLWGLQKIGAEAAWDASQGAGVVVAVVDTGLDYNHEDLAANVWQNPGETGPDASGNDRRMNGLDDDANGHVDDWRGWDFVTLDGTPDDNDPADNQGHGTHVGGTIAAVANNGLGVAGVAPLARVMALKALDANGNGSTEDLSRAIVYAADNGAAVINNSWGSSVSADTPQTLVEAVAHAHDVRGAVVVAAAGNSNQDVGTQAKGFYPACIRDVIAVSAFTHEDLKASFSNFGAKVDVAAPGGGDADPTGLVVRPDRSVLSLLSSTSSAAVNGSGQLVVGAKYLRQAGTSMASPHVAGAAALVRSLHPEFSPEQVRQALRRSSDDALSAGFDAQAGYGRLNVARALTEAAPLVAQLTQPTGTLTGLTQVSVTGTAAGPGLASWRLEYGAGTSPTSWTAVANSSQQVTEGVLAAWDLASVPDGTQTLRLVAQNASGQSYEDRLTVVVDNVYLSEPSATRLSVVRGGRALTIRGSAAPSNFSRYTLTVRASNGVTLTNAAVTLTNGGLQPVREDVLGTWDTTGVAADHYRVFLNVHLTSGALVQESVQVAVDPLLREGWPVNVGLLTSGAAAYAITDQLIAADLNGEGGKELVVAYNKHVHAYTHTGAELPGWPVSIDPQNTGARTQSGPAVADLDGDGSPEVVASNNSHQIFVFRADGTTLPGWPKNVGGVFTSLAVDDINGDGQKEIVAAVDGRLVALSAQGNYLPGFPVHPGAFLLPPAIADLDGDGQKEIVGAGDTGPTKLFVFNSNGTVRAGWPRLVNPTLASNLLSPSQPVLGDLDRDGDIEIVMGSADGKVYAFQHDGADLPGWPSATKAARVNAPAIGDIDGDGSPEVVAGNNTLVENNVKVNYIFAWRADGTPVPGWPVKYDRTISFSSFGFGAPALADLDGDGRADVIAASDANFEQPFALNAYRYDGTKVAGFPRPTFRTGSVDSCTVAVADLDGDGRLELSWIDGDGNLFVWNLSAPSTATMPWPMYMHDERHSGFSPRTFDTAPPSASINAPAAGALLRGTVGVAAQAADNLHVARVEFYVGASLVASDAAPPYAFDWNTTAAADGQHTLTAKAFDAAGNAGASAPVVVTVDNTPPSLNVTSPVNGSVVSGAFAAFGANSSDPNGVKRVDFYRDGGVLIASDTAAPYTVVWNTTTTANGAHTFYAVSTDAAGNSRTSPTVNFTVDNAPPVVSITSPTHGSTVRRKTSVTITANATDNVAVSRVEFYVGGALTCTDTAAPYTCAWLVPNVLSNYTISAKGYDTQGNSATHAVTVTSK